MARIKISHRLEYGIYRLFETSLRLLSVRSTVTLGEFLGKIAFHVLPKYRRIVSRNLRFAFGEVKSADELEDLTREVFRRNGANLLSSIRLPFLSDAELRKHVTFENTALLDQLHGLGKGILTVIPHMGNWELLAQAFPLLKPEAKGGAFYRKLNNVLMDRLIEKRRARRGIHLFAKHASTHKLSSFLRENGGLGILGDQRVPSRGDAVVFFGRPTTFSPLPALLAKRTGAALIGMHCRSSGPDHWTITFTEITEVTSQACATNLERAWRSSPADVFWFQDRWRLTGEKPLLFLEKMDPAAPVTKPLRVASTIPLTLPEKLARVELVALDPAHPISKTLDQLDASARYPADLYFCDEKNAPALREAAGRRPVLTAPPTPARPTPQDS